MTKNKMTKEPILTRHDILEFLKKTGISDGKHSAYFFNFDRALRNKAMSPDYVMKRSMQLRLKRLQDAYLEENAVTLAATSFAKARLIEKQNKREYVKRHRLGNSCKKIDLTNTIYILPRDPCVKCGVRGDIGCIHQPLGSL